MVMAVAINNKQQTKHQRPKATGLFPYIIDLYRRFDVHRMLGASSYGEQPSNAFTWQHALISLREISICISLLLAFYCKC